MFSSIVLILVSMFFSRAVPSQARGADGNTAFPALNAIDGHTHDLVPRGGKQPRQSEIERAAAAGLRGAVLAFPRETTPPAGLLRQIRIDQEAVRAYAARKAAEIAFVDRFDLSSVGEGGGAFQILASLEYFDGVFGGDLGVLDEVKAVGIRSVTLIDFPGDRLSEGRGESVRLSAIGQRVVGRMNEMEMAIDISHLPEPLQRDVIRTSRRPVIASHSNARAIAPVGRNLSDEILKEMTARGGLVLFTFDREFLFGTGETKESPGLPQLLKHVAHVVRLGGVDHVGLGSDYLGSGENAPPDLQGVECFKAIAEALTQSGYPAEAVEKILGGNIANFYSVQSGEKKTASPKLAGPYLGQKPPGLTPEIFAPGIVSIPGRQDYGCSFSPDGKDFFFTRGGMIMHCRDDGSGWTRPERAWFDSDALDHEPHVTADGTRLFWGSQRPQPGNPDPRPYGIWMIEKRQGGWFEPRFAGPGTQVSSTKDGTLYVTENDETGNGYLARVTMVDGKFVKYDRLMDGIETLRPRYERIAHPCIAPDGGYIVFDVEGGSHLFVSFMEADGHWGIPVDLMNHGFLKEDGIASVSPDGRFLFFGRGAGNERDIYWVSTKILEALKPMKKDPE